MSSCLNWGIAGSGKICNDFVVALSSLPKNDHNVVAVAARSQDSADSFAKTHSIPKSYQGYNSLAKDPNVQIVYVGVLNPQHFDVSKMMLENGKHVLCEKPLTMNEKQTRQLIDLAKNKKLFLMEAVWSRCFPAYEELRTIVEKNEIGEIQQVNVNFGFNLTNVERLQTKEMGGGSILDLGVYVLQFQQFIFRGLKPIKVVASGNLNKYGTDANAAAIITYPGEKMAVVSCNATAELDNTARISGTKGSVTIPFFWCPKEINILGKLKAFNWPKIKYGNLNFINSEGLSYEAEEARKCIKSGLIESPKITHEESLQLAQLMDSLRKQVGVLFPADEV